jgi:AGCS family alanine or glycine:cation symporter
MSPLVVKITRNYVARKLHGKAEEPVLSYDEAVQKEMAEAVAKGEE